MHLGVRGGGVQGAAVAQHPLGAAVDDPAGQLDHRHLGPVRRLGAPGVQVALPGGERGFGLLAAQAAGQALLRGAPAGGEVGEEAAQPRPQHLGQPLQVGVTLLQVHVQVAGGTGEGAEGGKVAAGGFDHLRRQHLLDQAQAGAGAADGHAQVVEELRVEIVDGPRQVAADGHEQLPVDVDHGLAGGAVGVQADTELGAVVERPAAGGAAPLLEAGQGRGRSGDAVFPEEPAHRGQFLIVAAQGEQPHQAEGLCGRGRPLPLEHQPGHGLVVLVEQPHLAADQVHPRQRQQGAHAEQRREQIAQRTGREIAGKAARTQLRTVLLHGHLAGVAVVQGPAAVVAVDEVAALIEPPVEGIGVDHLGGVLRKGLEAERAGQGGHELIRPQPLGQDPGVCAVQRHGPSLSSGNRR